MNGLLIIDKPEGLTSAEVVRRVKARLHVKVGHLGTLDPFATGLLPLCLGEGTKIAQFLNTAGKSYTGRIRLGAATDSGDRTGSVVRSAEVPALRPSDLRALEQKFSGAYTQTPPMYSAIKQAGVPLYKLARKGVEVEREPRTVQIDTFRLTAVEPTCLEFEVACSKGTYVRVLAEDVGLACGSVAHLETLRRTRFGTFDLSAAVSLESWDPQKSDWLISIRDALSHLPLFEIATDKAQAARKGQTWVLDAIERPAQRQHALLCEQHGDLIAVLERSGERWHFARVFHGTTAALQA